MLEPIAIVGMSCVFPQSRGLHQYWARLVAGEELITPVPEDRFRCRDNHLLPPEHEAHLPSWRGGFVPTPILIEPARFGLIPRSIQFGDADQFLMLLVADRALRDAGIPADAECRQRTDVIVGRGGYPTLKLGELNLRAEAIHALLDLLERRFPAALADGRRSEMDKYLRGTMPERDPESISTTIPNLVASLTANRLNLSGAAYTVDAACASSLVAVDHAVDRLRERKADVAIAGGLFLNHGPSFWFALHELGALSKTGKVRAFDRRADGLVVGEGCGAVVLKRLSDARRHRDRVYAVIRALGVSSDGRNTGVLAPSPAGQIKALERAYEACHVDRESIGYLELHGTGTTIGDLIELETIKTFFGRSEAAVERSMGSVKTMIGHLLPAAGMASLIKVALALSNKVLPPSLNCEQPVEELSDAPFFLNTNTRPWVRGHGPRRAGINCFGFGGINAHAILEEVVEVKRSRRGCVRPRPICPAAPRRSELLLFSGRQPMELAERLADAERLIQHNVDVGLESVASLLASRRDVTHACQLAIVGTGRTDLARKLAATRAQFSSASPGSAIREDVYYCDHTAGGSGKVAFVFPSVDYIGLNPEVSKQLMQLAELFPEVRTVLDQFEAQRQLSTGLPALPAMLDPPQLLSGATRQWLQQQLVANPSNSLVAGMLNPSPIGIALASWIGWTLLDGLRVPVDMFIGQSLGELIALAAAEAADMLAGFRCLQEVLPRHAETAVSGRSAFVLGSEEDVLRLLGHDNTCVIAMHITPRALVLAGEPGPLKQAVKRLQDGGIVVQPLPYPPVHSKFCAPIRQRLAADPWHHWPLKRLPNKTVYSSILAAPYPRKFEELAATAMLNLDQPLKIWQTILRAYDDGARIFVQVAGDDIVAQIPAMLRDDAMFTVVGLDFSDGNPLRQIHRLVGRLLTVGVHVDPTFLWKHCDLQPIVPVDPAGLPATDERGSKPGPRRMRIPLRFDWSPLTHESVPPRALASASISDSPRSEATEPLAGPGASLRTRSLEDAPPGIDLTELVTDAAQLERLRRLPVLGRITHLAPEQSLVIHRTLDLDEDLFLRDHVFYHAPGIKPVEDCMPSVPLTFSIEFMAEAAGLLSPGRQLIGLEDLRAQRWIALRNCRTAQLRIEATVLNESAGVRPVRVSIFCDDALSISATVLFAPETRVEVQFTMTDHRHHGPWPMRAEDVYRDRYTFQGPRLQTITNLETLSNPVCSGTVSVPPYDQLFASNPQPLLLTDPCVIDGAGTLFGLWCCMFQLHALPIMVKKIEFYGPPPRVGRQVPVRVEVTEYDAPGRQVRCNIEIEDGEGCVWARVVEWTDWVFDCRPDVADVLRDPFRHAVAEELRLPGLPSDAVCSFLLNNRARDPIVAESLASSYLQLSELKELDEITHDGARNRAMLARIAAKDATRIWWSRRYETVWPHPASFVIEHDERGKPILQPREQSMPHISLSHSQAASVAVASAEPVGIDLEPLSRRTTDVLDQFTTADERELLRAWSDQTAATQLWCCKEAVAKLLGTGFDRVSPREIKVVDREGDTRWLLQHTPSGDRFEVHTAAYRGYILAFTTHAGVREAHAR